MTLDPMRASQTITLLCAAASVTAMTPARVSLVTPTTTVRPQPLRPGRLVASEQLPDVAELVTPVDGRIVPTSSDAEKRVASQRAAQPAIRDLTVALSTDRVATLDRELSDIDAQLRALKEQRARKLAATQSHEEGVRRDILAQDLAPEVGVVEVNAAIGAARRRER